MKRIFVMMLLMMGFGCAQAQEHEIEVLLLDVEKLLQFKQILTDMQDGYDILVKGYGTVRDLSQGNFDLHKGYLDGLQAVSPAVQGYARIGDIIALQVQLTKEYKAAIKRFSASDLLSLQEMDYVTGVYGRVYKASLTNLEDLVQVITAATMRMSDDERLKNIDRIYKDLTDQWLFVRTFTSDNAVLLMQRKGDRKDVRVLRDLLK